MIDFKLAYDRARYLSFLRAQLLPEDFVESEETVSPSFEPQFIRNVIKLGEVPSLDLCIYEAEHPSENDPRVALSRDTFRLMAQYGKKRALVFLVSKNSQNFRLSLVTIDLKWEEGKRAQKEYSNPRRYSFFLGPETKTHTPEEYLVELGRVKDFEDLKNRFSIEIVNKEFYTQIAFTFTRLAGGKRESGRKSIDAGDGDLKLPSTNDDTLRKEFTVRLIGRLVFCWFLKKKKSDKGLALLSEDLLSTKAVGANKGYYHSILESLFFEVLNTQVEERGKKYKSVPWNQTPFLNGGLFNPHHHDFYETGTMGISKHINTLKIPDDWFKDLFEIFETYNFTIDENTSVDVELSIEPEMLGRIFENLLAEINPETGETARKATGSYYTPRPIVEYMVDESLKQCLITKTSLTDGKISALLTYNDQDAGFSAKEKEAVIEALDTIKIIDPACGSGAFPMGMLQKMLLVLQKVDPESQSWLDKKLASIGDATLRKDLKAKIKADNFNYIHKLGIIRDAIYGVDIQPIAVEISKLRFFLSLIVDEKVNDSKENRGIEPLPNLEFKFVCANSLIGLPKPTKPKDVGQAMMFESNEDIKILKDLRDEYLRSFGEEKNKIEKKFQEVQSRMFKYSLNWGGKDSQTLKLSQWNPFSEEPCSWFDPDWMFGVKDGFDIVIANPPYLRVQGLQETQPELVPVYKKNYKAAQGSFDLYALFIERGFNILNDKGNFSYIVPHKFFQATFGKGLRELLNQAKALCQIVRFGAEQIFDAATTYTCLLFLSRKPQTRFVLHEVKDLANVDRVLDSIQNGIPDPGYESAGQSQPTSDDWDFHMDKAGKLLDKLAEQGVTLGDITRKIFQGIATSADDIYVLRLIRKDGGLLTCYSKQLDTEVQIERGLVKPFLMGKNVHRYAAPMVENVVIFPYDIKDGSASLMTQARIKADFPLGWKYLLKNRGELEAREHGRFKDCWHCFSRPQNLKEFQAVKIMTPEIALGCQMTIDSDGDLYHTTKVYSFVFNQKASNHLLFFLGILNSPLLWYFLKSTGYVLRGGYYTFKTEYLRPFPIVCSQSKNPPSAKDQAEIVELVKKRLRLGQAPKGKTSEIEEIERTINATIYRLYSLTKEEIAIVEGRSSKIDVNGRPAKSRLEKTRCV